MRVLFTSIRVPSHFLPLVPFIEACRRRGHEVAVAAPSEFRERVTATGAVFFPLAHPGDAALEPIWKRQRAATGEESKRVSFGELFAGALAAAALPSLVEILSQWRPAVVVRESQEYAALVAAEKVGIPHLHVAITASHAEVETFAFAAPALDALGQSIGLPPDPQAERLYREAILTLFPQSLEDPEFEPRRVERYRAAGVPVPPPLPDWWHGSQAPFVYVTLGTVTSGMEQMRSAYRVALEALRPLPIRALLTTGGDLPPALLGDVPAHVHLERFVPQGEVLPHARAILCHGGSGSVIGALSAGVPLVVAPLFADQMNNAKRVAALGAGLALPKRTEAAVEIQQALAAVLERDSFRLAAQRVASEIAALPPVDDAALELERRANG